MRLDEIAKDEFLDALKNPAKARIERSIEAFVKSLPVKHILDVETVRKELLDPTKHIIVLSVAVEKEVLDDRIMTEIHDKFKKYFPHSKFNAEWGGWHTKDHPTGLVTYARMYIDE